MKISKRIWIFCGVAIVILAAMFYDPERKPNSDYELTSDAEKCAGMTGPQCWDALALERRRREFVESREGQEMLRAADAVYGSGDPSEK